MPPLHRGFGLEFSAYIYFRLRERSLQIRTTVDVQGQMFREYHSCEGSRRVPRRLVDQNNPETRGDRHGIPNGEGEVSLAFVTLSQSNLRSSSLGHLDVLSGGCCPDALNVWALYFPDLRPRPICLEGFLACAPPCVDVAFRGFVATPVTTAIIRTLFGHFRVV